MMSNSSKTDYQPKHLKEYAPHMGHCCFAGCTPRGCPGRCCVQEFGHRYDCPMNATRQYDEATHDIYVANGLRKHLKAPSPSYYDPSRDWGAFHIFRRCSCGEIARYPNGCAASGCMNRPA